MRLRDFDELFFFAGANETDIERFHAEAKARGLVLRNAGQFWSLACGSDLAKCVRELGGLYDRALRSHALRVGLRVLPGDGGPKAADDNWPSSVFDRTLALTERIEPEDETQDMAGEDSESVVSFDESSGANTVKYSQRVSVPTDRTRFHLHAPEVWDEVLACLAAGSLRR